MINYLKYTLVFFLFSIHSQEIPPIQSFQPDDYDADIQNWMITQSDDGSIVVANSSGVLTYNGSWKFYESPNSTIIRSVKYIDGKIYSGKKIKARLCDFRPSFLGGYKGTPEVMISIWEN